MLKTEVPLLSKAQFEQSATSEILSDKRYTAEDL